MMRVIVLGAGVIGVSTAWHLVNAGHDVIVVDRSSNAAQETSFANAGQISVSYSAPWAHPGTPWLALKWLFDARAPLLFRPRMDWRQWQWCLQFLGQCRDSAYQQNFRQILALGRYSHAVLRETILQTGIEFQRLEKGIAHIYTSEKSFDAVHASAGFWQDVGIDRRVVCRDELYRIEPALKSFASEIVGATYSPTDETGNARIFTTKLAELCAQKGVRFMYGHQIVGLEKPGNEVTGVHLRDCREGTSTNQAQVLTADAYVVALGPYTRPVLRGVGVDVPIYPGKGYSASFPILKPEKAPSVSVVEDKTMAISRLGDVLRVAGTVEISDYATSIDTARAKARCAMLAERIEAIFPGVCDTRSDEEGGNPGYWCGLRPATPDSVPLIGRTKVDRLWVNAGHGTLGWTQSAGSGKAIAELISGRKPDTEFMFCGI